MAYGPGPLQVPTSATSAFPPDRRFATESLMFMPRRLFAALVAFGNLPAAAQTPAQNDSSARAAVRTNSLPLINTRTLKFTTDEGSWISVDLSPDGRTIVFDLLGDLYTI